MKFHVNNIVFVMRRLQAISDGEGNHKQQLLEELNKE
jgi:hypothetical protein